MDTFVYKYTGHVYRDKHIFSNETALSTPIYRYTMCMCVYVCVRGGQWQSQFSLWLLSGQFMSHDFLHRRLNRKKNTAPSRKLTRAMKWKLKKKKILWFIANEASGICGDCILTLRFLLIDTIDFAVRKENESRKIKAASHIFIHLKGETRRSEQENRKLNFDVRMLKKGHAILRKTFLGHRFC